MFSTKVRLAAAYIAASLLAMTNLSTAVGNWGADSGNHVSFFRFVLAANAAMAITTTNPAGETGLTIQIKRAAAAIKATITLVSMGYQPSRPKTANTRLSNYLLTG
jgi:hypothetical protein